MICQSCGAQAAPDAGTCPTCGAALTPPGAGPTAPGPGGPPGAAPSGGPAPHPSGLSSEVRNWAMAAHLSSFLGAFVGLAVLGPLVVWLIRREADAFSEQHAREALNFNLTLLLLFVAGIVLSIVTVGIGLLVVVPVGLVVAVVWIVVSIVAAIRASEGRAYRYPITIRFVS